MAGKPPTKSLPRLPPDSPISGVLNDLAARLTPPPNKPRNIPAPPRISRLARPLTEIEFQCDQCGHRFRGAPTVHDAPELDYHPWRYTAACPECAAEAEEVRQHQSLRRSYSKSTGPRTEEGKARCKFNGMRHGAFARTAQYFPAKPGSKWCAGCDIQPDYCRSQPACIRNTELLLRHRIAYATKDPALLRELRADTMSDMQAILNQMILDIAQRGVVIEKPEIYIDATGAMRPLTDHHGQPVNAVAAHPLLKHLSDTLAKLGMTHADSGMTERQQTEETLIQGHLEAKGSADQTEMQIRDRQARALEDLTALFERASQRTRADPALAHQRDEPDEPPDAPADQ